MQEATRSTDRILNMTAPETPGNPAGSYVVVILVLVLVLVAAYYTTRFIAGRGRAYARGKYLRVRENLFFGRDKSVMLLESCKEYYVIGMTNQQMQLLGTISKAELSALPEDAPSGMDGLRGALGRVYQNAKSAKSAPEDLRKAQAAYREANAAATPKQGRSVLQMLKRTPSGEEVPTEHRFAQDLEAASARMAQEDEPPSVIVDLSTSAENAAGVTPELLQRKEDEIDRMMQSIEQRTQELRQRRGKESGDEES